MGPFNYYESLSLPIEKKLENDGEGDTSCSKYDLKCHQWLQNRHEENIKTRLQHSYDWPENWEESWRFEETCCFSNSSERPSANSGMENSQLNGKFDSNADKKSTTSKNNKQKNNAGKCWEEKKKKQIKKKMIKQLEKIN